MFYPLTIWRIVTRPLTTMAYSDAEQSGDPEDRYDDALSPPLLLLITVVLVNLVGTALHVETPKHPSSVSRAIFESPENLAIFRGLIFSLVPLVSAATLLRRQGQPLSRVTLRGPFNAQCYLATPCAIIVGLGAALVHRSDVPSIAGAALMLFGAGWFLVTQTRWFADRLRMSYLRAGWTAFWALVRAVLYLFALLIPVALI
jgi:predicted permease